jgi:hypothetical protein
MPENVKGLAPEVLRTRKKQFVNNEGMCKFDYNFYQLQAYKDENVFNKTKFISQQT